MSSPGRPKGEYRRAQPEGTPVSRKPVISRSSAHKSGSAGRAAPAEPPLAVAEPKRVSLWARWLQRLKRHERLLWAAGVVIASGVAGWPAWHPTGPAPLPVTEIDEALRESIAKEPLASAIAAAHEAVAPSVVRIEAALLPPAEAASAAGKGPSAETPGPPSAQRPRANGPRGPTGSDSAHNPTPPKEEEQSSVGSGVVIVDNGLILTNLHVIDGRPHITVTFADGSESPAELVRVERDLDLAVLRARKIPDDLQAATMRSTAGLRPGEEVVAVGFPFGIGPSVSAGVVSGLGRRFRAHGSNVPLTGLIQFDAAANPGNSGGPLVTLDGHVVGIVTAIMNPTPSRTFIGIGFAVPIEAAAGAAGMPPF